MSTQTYVNARGVALSTMPASGTEHYFWAAAPGTVTSAPGGGHTLYADGFSDTFYLYSATDQVIVPAGMAGVDTVMDDAWNAAYTLAPGVQNLVLTGNDQVATGNAGNDLIIAQSGTQTMIAGSGDDVFVCDSSPNTIDVQQGGGSQVIYGFINGLDHVSLVGSTQFANFAAVQAAMTQVGSNVLLTMGSGQTITFENARVGAFVQSDFYLPLNLAGMSMTFDGTFNTFSASPSGIGTIWSTTLGHGGRTLPANHEAEYYSDSSVGVSPFSVANGILTITAAPTNPASNALSLPYTSGAITTDHSFAQLYGYFEMSAKLPAGQGFWPAFWLLPANGTWPPELDAMEQIGSQPNTDYVTAHFVNNGTEASVGASVDVGPTNNGFNTYGVYWTPTVIEWFFNGQEIASAPTPADMNTPMYMTVNLAVGGTGSWPGVPASGATAQMEVQYVHAYAYTGTGSSGTPGTIVGTPEAPATAVLSSTTLNFGVVHIGGSATQAVTITNATTGAAVDLLIGGFGTLGGPYIGDATLGSGLAGGTSGTLDVTLPTTTAGMFDTTATLSLASADPVTGETGVATPTIALIGTIDNYATAAVEVTGGPAMTGTAPDFTINLGTVDAQTGASVDLEVLNGATGVADLLSGGFRIYGPSAFENTGLGAFAGLASQQADTGLTVTLDSSISGIFSETIVVSPAGSNASGYFDQLAKETITVTGTVAPIYVMTPGVNDIGTGPGNNTIYAASADINPGDVINGGAGINVLMLQGGGAFDLNEMKGFVGVEVITAQEGVAAATETVTLRNYVDLTLDVLPANAGTVGSGITINAGANNDVINLGRGTDVVTVGGTGQTVNGGGHDTIYVPADKLTATLNGGGPGSTLVVTSAGKAVLGNNITGFGTVTLAQTAGAVDLQMNAMSNVAIIGSAIGSDTIVLGGTSQSVVSGGPNEHVEAAGPLAGALVAGLGQGSELEITSGTSVALNPGTGGSMGDSLIVKLDQAGTLTLSKMAFVTAVGSGGDTIIAGAAGQVLTGGGTGSTLVGVAGGGDIFRDTTADMNGATIQNFVPGDSLDLINLVFANAKLNFSAARGMLSVTDGYRSAAINLPGTFSAAGFTLTSDGSSGTAITYHHA